MAAVRNARKKSHLWSVTFNSNRTRSGHRTSSLFSKLFEGPRDVVEARCRAIVTAGEDPESSVLWHPIPDGYTIHEVL